ncbi:MAG: PLDc N-terminal domain-containing protein [Jatrophihabitantaceae bacterium]
MLMFDGVFGLVMLGLWIFCIIDAITAPVDKVRNLPKIAWILIVILLVVPGSIVWLIAGRPWAAAQQGGDRPVRSAKRPVASNPDDDEEFLAGLRARAEEQRRRARDTQPRDDDKPGETAS